MTFDMTHPDENWLDRALSDKPQIDDAGFSDAVVTRIRRYERMRRVILALSICAACIMALWVVPWAHLFGWAADGGSLAMSVATTLKAPDIGAMLSQFRGLLTSLIAAASMVVVIFALWVTYQD